MSPTRPDSQTGARLDELVEAAARVFARRGFRRAQMADVAREMGVAAGTLYRYVRGKEALFDLVVQRAFHPHELPLPNLPVATPGPGAVAAHLRERFDDIGRTPLLLRAVESPTPADPAAELRQLLCELYELLDGHQQGLRVIERSAADRPDLARVYFQEGRARMLESWERYLIRRTDAGVLAPLPDARIAARLVLETIAWWAWHRHDDPAPVAYDAAAAREAAVALLMRALLRAGLQEDDA